MCSPVDLLYIYSIPEEGDGVEDNTSRHVLGFKIVSEPAAQAVAIADLRSRFLWIQALLSYVFFMSPPAALNILDWLISYLHLIICNAEHIILIFDNYTAVLSLL